MAIDDAKLWKLTLFGEEIRLLYKDHLVTMSTNDSRLLALLASWHGKQWSNSSLYQALYPPRTPKIDDPGDTIRNNRKRLCRTLLKQMNQEAALDQPGVKINDVLKPLFSEIEVDVAIFDLEFSAWQESREDITKEREAISHCKNALSCCSGLLLKSWPVSNANDQVYSWLIREKIRRRDNYQKAFTWLMERDRTYCESRIDDAVWRGLLNSELRKTLKVQRDERLEALVATLQTPSHVDQDKAAEADQGKLDNHVGTYYEYAAAEQYDAAWNIYLEHFDNHLDFVRSRGNRQFRLLLKLFPEGLEQSPRLTSPVDRAAALHALARSYKNKGQPKMAVEIYNRPSYRQEASGKVRIQGLANLANCLRLMGRLREAEGAAERMFDNAAEQNLPFERAYSLYWNGVLRAARGSVEEGVLLFRQAQVLFQDIEDQSTDYRLYIAAIGRTYAQLAQVELWLGNGHAALNYASRSMQLTDKHGERREIIFSTRLIGTANLLLSQLDNSRSRYEIAVKDAHDCGYFEEELAARIGLAELDRREGKYLRAHERLNDDIRRKAEAGPYKLLLTDFHCIQSRIYEDEGNREKAIELATLACKTAWCDEPPHYYHWGLHQAEKRLIELKAPYPVGLGADAHSPPSLPANVTGLDASQLCRADLRAEFTKFLRTIMGTYRYAPTKFLRMLQEDWGVIRDIVVGKEVRAIPQFVEVHVEQHCNLKCVFCKGNLREVPENEVCLGTEIILRLVDEIYELNPHAFVRFSGTIGEPLLHRDIVSVFEAVGRKDGLQWGVTTNGILLDHDRRRALLGINSTVERHAAARYVHISIDAGTDDTFHELKRGKLGNFTKVMENIGLLVEERANNADPQIIVSFLLQTENYGEIEALARKLKIAGVDSLEIKMQHFDARRGMPAEDVKRAYDLVGDIECDLSNADFRVVVVQTEEEALGKIQNVERPITFSKCYANMLGLNPTVDPIGNVQTCCQYYQKTLGPVGNIKDIDLKSVWSSDSRRETLARDPRTHCINCSPSDQFVNRFVHFLKEAHERDDSFLNWVEQEVALIRGIDQGE